MTDFLPERPGETDDERSLREALNKSAARLLRDLDAAMDFRSGRKVPAEAARTRHRVRGHIADAAVLAMHAYALALAVPPHDAP